MWAECNYLKFLITIHLKKFYQNQNDLKPFLKLLEILDNPYKKNKDTIEYQSPSPAKEKYQTFCGT